MELENILQSMENVLSTPLVLPNKEDRTKQLQQERKLVENQENLYKIKDKYKQFTI